MKLNKIEIGHRLKEFADSNFLSYKDFAAAIGMAPNNIHSFYFNGKSLPGAQMIARLLEFNCDIRWLLTGEAANLQPDHTVNEEKHTYTPNIDRLEQELNYYKQFYELFEKLYSKEEQLIKEFEEKRKKAQDKSPF